jgi:hypothetical protein
MENWKLGLGGLTITLVTKEQLYGFLIDKIPSFLGQEVDSLEEQIFSCLYI